MRVENKSMLDLMASLLRGTELGRHQARVKSLSGLLSGLLLSEEASLSGMARGLVALSETDTFRGKLKQAHYLLKNDHFDSWNIAKALYDRLTEGLSRVVIAVDWTQVGHYLMLEASLVVEGRAIGFYGRSVLKEELQGRQRSMEQSMEYALEAFRRPEQHLYVVVDRGFAALDYIGPSALYPYVHRITRLTKHMILNWDGIEGPLQAWPLWEGETVAIENAILGRKRPVRCSVVLAQVGEHCYLACDPQSVAVALAAYQKRPWIENQNRDLKSTFAVHKMRFLNGLRLDRMWSLLGIAFALIHTQSRTLLDLRERWERKYSDGRQDLSWLSLVRYANHLSPFPPRIKPLTI